MSLFRATAHFPDDNGDEVESSRKAGVYRGTRSLFMNIDSIPAGEWNFLLVHELTHQADPVLARSSAVWNDPSIAEAIFRWSKESDSVDELSVDQREQLRAYVKSGLERGLLSEYRSWLFCLSVYEEGVRTKLWGRISWVDEILRTKKETETLEHFTLQFLDARFKDPQPQGLFSLPIVQQELRAFRAEIRSGIGPVLEGLPF